MPRALRYQYPRAFYHVMARGDGGKAVFKTDEDGKSFLFRLGQVCESHGWRVHVWVFMKNHFHLLLETPEPNAPKISRRSLVIPRNRDFPSATSQMKIKACAVSCSCDFKSRFLSEVSFWVNSKISIYERWLDSVT